ncbi:MAG: flagellar motor switch protein FliN [Burkholderiaceae bacterium]|uniref:flagellar motor switch protein FliN n=1 Tax=Castellaniella sp. TaxID=1955812 RepID=UPI00355CFDBC
MSDTTPPNETDPAPGTDTAVDDDIWAAALAEQAAQTAAGPAGTTQTNVDETAGTGETAGTDETARASGATAAAAQSAARTASAAAERIFQPIQGEAQASGNSLDRILDIPVELSVELGRTQLTLKNILQLGQGSVVELDGQAGEPMDIYINGYLIAQGEVVVVGDQYGVRITDIITPSDRLARINQRR